MPSQTLRPEAMLLNPPHTHFSSSRLGPSHSRQPRLVDPRGLGRGHRRGPHWEARSEGNLGLGLCVPEPYRAVHVTLGPPLPQN